MSIKDKIKALVKFKNYVESCDYKYFYYRVTDRSNAEYMGHKVTPFTDLQAFKDFMGCREYSDYQTIITHDYELFNKGEMIRYIDVWVRNLLRICDNEEIAEIMGERK